MSLFPSTVTEVTSISEQRAYYTRSGIQCITCLDIWRGKKLSKEWGKGPDFEFKIHTNSYL